MTASQAADVADFSFRKTPPERVVQLRLRPGDEARGAIADEHFLPLVFLFQKVVKRHRAERDCIAEQRLITERACSLGGLSGAGFSRSLDHALEKIFADAFAE